MQLDKAHRNCAQVSATRRRTTLFQGKSPGKAAPSWPDAADDPPPDRVDQPWHDSAQPENP